jgi:hypothetical protein
MQVVRYGSAGAALTVLVGALFATGIAAHAAPVTRHLPRVSASASATAQPEPDPAVSTPASAVPSVSPSPSRLSRRPVAQGRAGAPVARVRESLAPQLVGPSASRVLLLPVPVAAVSPLPALSGYLIYAGTSALITALGGLLMLGLTRRRW